MHAANKLPILVGGTAYYAQHLIFPSTSLPSSTTSTQLSAETQASIQHLRPDLAALLKCLPDLPAISSPASFPPGFPTHKLPESLRESEAFASALWQLFNALDPQGAQRWHWRDVRKVRRHLELFLAGSSESSSAVHDMKSKYRVLVFWLHCEREVLIERLNARVDSMVEVSFHSIYTNALAD